jgi:hypothetical protein
MALTVGTYGLRPIKALGDRPYTGGSIREIPLAAGAGTALGVGDLVTSASGVGAAIGTIPTPGTANGNTPYGVCVGVRFNDPTLKQQQYGQYLPANTTGYTNMFARVVDDPDMLFQIRYEGTLTSTAVGRNVSWTYGAPSATTGVSTSYATGIAVTATLPFRVIDIVGSGTDSSGAAYTDILVTYNNIHAYRLVTGL